GRCPGCGEWNTLVEERAAAPARSGGLGSARAGRPAAPVRLRDVEAAQVARLSTGIAELDRVLGGGIVPGSLVLIGGSPGIGKSTLTLAAIANVASAAPSPKAGSTASTTSAGAARGSVLYVTGEESAAQVRLRAERLSPAALDVPIIAETDVAAIEATIQTHRPSVCVIDSVQT